MDQNVIPFSPTGQRSGFGAAEAVQAMAPAFAGAVPVASAVIAAGPESLPAFPAVIVGIDSVARRVPWWLMLVGGVAAGWWLSSKWKSFKGAGS